MEAVFLQAEFTLFCDSVISLQPPYLKTGRPANTVHLNWHRAFRVMCHLTLVADFFMAIA